MKPWITAIAAETAAGSGIEALVWALHRGAPITRPAPWGWPELRGLGVAAVDRDRGGCGVAATADLMAGDAELLLANVVRAVAPPQACGLVVGTSSGDISGPFERGERHHPRQAPIQRVAERLGAPFTTVSVACASGAAAFDVARGWLRSGRCERVIVAGVDALSRFIHAGFAGLGALAEGHSRPFTIGRDGLMLGEGAAAILLETPGSARRYGRTALCALHGTGLSQDAVHLTAPDRTGGGLYRAAASALLDAGLEAGQMDVVSAHGTGTAFNDAMEARALSRLFGGWPVPLHAAKPVIGHTLGAAGAIEAVAVIAMLNGGPVPKAMQVDPGLGLKVCPSPTDPAWGLSVNSAFGGVNVALVFGPAADPDVDASDGLSQAPVLASEPVLKTWEHIAVNQLPPLADGTPPLTLGRADLYVRSGIMALKEAGARATDGIVLSSSENCILADQRYLDALNARGPAQAPRVQFVYTVPGAPLAEAAILLQLTGPGLVLCDGHDAGDVEARRLVAEGRVERAIAVHVECARPQSPATTRFRVYARG